MPTLEKPRNALPSRTETVISTALQGWQQKAVRSMRRRDRFVLETACPSFDPSDTGAPALFHWLRGTASGVTGGHFPAAAGLVLLGIAALIPIPICRALLAALGILGLLSVGLMLLRLIVARYTYRWRVAYDPERRKYHWFAEPLD